MATTTYSSSSRRRHLVPAVRLVVTVLALATAWIHAWMGGTLFLLNAAGYVTLTVALLVPLPSPLRDARWLARLALLAFTMATIVGWALFGARFWLAYLDKAIELVLVVAVVLDIWLSDGGPDGIADQARRLGTRLGAGSGLVTR